MKDNNHYKRKRRYEGADGVTYIPTKKMTTWLWLNRLRQWARDKLEPKVIIHVGDFTWVDTTEGEVWVEVDSKDFANFLNGEPHSGGEV